MYGFHGVPFHLDIEGTSITTQQMNSIVNYRRNSGDECVEKNILMSDGGFLIEPIEPTTLPKNISNILNIRFKKELVIGPKESRMIFLTFPVDIGVFLVQNNKREVIDIFSFENQKYTLYGSMVNGVISRYWKSEIYTEMPTIDNTHKGIMKLSIINPLTTFVAVNKVLLNSLKMILYYDESMVFINAVMQIKSVESAEIFFLKKPFNHDMIRANKVYPANNLKILQDKYLMESGI